LNADSSHANEGHAPAQLNADSSIANEDKGVRFFAFMVLAASAIAVPVTVLMHGPRNSHSEKTAHRSHDSGSAFTSPSRRPHTYFNQRFGFSISYPQTFRAGKLPENGDGCEFESPRGDARLNAFGSNNDGNGIVAEYDGAMQDVRGVLGYHKLGGNWFVVTWSDGSNINYQKTFVGIRSINTFVFSYPQDRKDEFDPMVTAIEKSFRPGNLEQAW
jgi:hypothetical protein